MNILSIDDRSDLQQYAGFGALPAAGNAAGDVVKTVGVLEEARPAPVRGGVVVLRDGERRALQPRLRDREQRGEAVGRRPPGAACVEQDFRVGRNARKLVENLLEGIIVE